MSSGNGTIDYDVEAHTLDAHKTSAARQESTTRNLQLQFETENEVSFLVVYETIRIRLLLLQNANLSISKPLTDN